MYFAYLIKCYAIKSIIGNFEFSFAYSLLKLSFLKPNISLKINKSFFIFCGTI